MTHLTAERRRAILERATYWLTSNIAKPYGSPKAERELDISHHNEGYDIITGLLAELDAAEAALIGAQQEIRVAIRSWKATADERDKAEATAEALRAALLTLRNRLGSAHPESIGSIDSHRSAQYSRDEIAALAALLASEPERGK